MKISDYILEILHTKPYIFDSWGPDNIQETDDGIKFSVSGFLHQGEVEITYDDAFDAFDVNIIKDGNKVKTVEGVYFDELVNVVDGLVEFDGDKQKYHDLVVGKYNIDL